MRPRISRGWGRRGQLRSPALAHRRLASGGRMVAVCGARRGRLACRSRLRRCRRDAGRCRAIGTGLSRSAGKLRGAGHYGCRAGPGFRAPGPRAFAALCFGHGQEPPEGNRAGALKALAAGGVVPRVGGRHIVDLRPAKTRTSTPSGLLPAGTGIASTTAQRASSHNRTTKNEISQSSRMGGNQKNGPLSCNAQPRTAEQPTLAAVVAGW